MSKFRTITVDRNLLVDLIKKTTDGHIKYKLGAKAPSIDCDSSEIKAIDCSGFVRWLLHQVSGETFPDGSWNMCNTILHSGFEKCIYSDCAKLDDRMRIAFITPESDKPGHVWLVINGMTLESYGGHGPGRRAWNTRTLKSKVDYCFVLTGDM